MCFDESKRRLITGTRTGNINIWNFNNGALLHTLPKTSDVEITSLSYIRERIISGMKFGTSKFLENFRFLSILLKNS